jgi:outer membrane biosynthesis protein TonB
MTKLDAIATVLEQNLGEVLHQDTIIQMLYGDLSLEELKKERVRMDTLLRNGVKNNKWKKAPVPASYVLEATAAGAKPKRPGRKSEPTKEPKPKPQPEPVAEVAPAKAKAAKPKPGRKPAVGKAKASQKVARSKKTELELVALLRKADIQV